MAIRYANGGGAARAAHLTVNDGGNGQHSLTFENTGAWTAWQTVPLQLDLVQGVNILQLISDSSEGLANIDHLVVSGAEQVSAGSCAGVDSSSGSTSSGGLGGDDNSRRSACTSVQGTEFVNSTIRVAGPFDGGCREYVATFGDGSQQEGQDPVFRLERGSSLTNVFVGPNGDGIHVHGDATLTNITWRDVAEDALTVKSEANVTIRNFEAYKAADKVFQLNAKTTFLAQNCTVVDMGKMFRENGGKCYPANVTVENCHLDRASDAIFRSDCGSTVMTLRNSTVLNAKVCYSNSFQCHSN